MPRIPNESLDHIITVFQDHGGIMTTAEAEAHLDYSRSGVWRRLTRLENEGILERERDGRAIQWILRPDAELLLSGELYEGNLDLTGSTTDTTDE